MLMGLAVMSERKDRKKTHPAIERSPRGSDDTTLLRGYCGSGAVARPAPGGAASDLGFARDGTTNAAPDSFYIQIHQVR
jgi:hypothetical protein